MGTPGVDPSDTHAFRAELERILASPEFASSRQLQEFLRYTSAKALEGSTHLDQVEIASAVLGRGPDFNPLDDASVRKLASQTRQRLEHYYSRTGSGSEYLVTLPVRSYVPRLQRRELIEAVPATGRRLWPVVLAAALGLLAVAAAITWKWRPLAAGPDAAAIVIETVKGDVQDMGDDAAPASIRVGRVLDPVDEVVTRLDFVPSLEAQQAGVMVWQDGDHYIRLGRRFFGRNQIEFRLEEGGKAAVQHARYDPEGQTGAPIWLALRRNRDRYGGWISYDGVRWEPVHDEVSPGKPFTAPRSAIYAFNGRRDTRSTIASFTETATGVTFAGMERGGVEALVANGWRRQSGCGDGLAEAVDGQVLRLSLGPEGGCNWELGRPIEAAEWEIVTRVDFFPMPGASAGLNVRGDKGALRLVRYFLNGPAISLIHDGKTLVGVPDLNGSPAVVLRLRAKDGRLTGGFSADGVRFRDLEGAIPLAQLGGNLRAGIRFSRQGSADPSSIRFYYWRQRIGPLRDHR